jgi:hypothetical protein
MEPAAITDPIQRLFDWFKTNGGIGNVEVRMDKDGVRGLYASKSI